MRNALLFLAAAALWWSGVPAAYAQTPEDTLVVEGQIVNGTAGGETPSGLSVMLHQRSVARSDNLEVTADSEGRFRFEGVVFDPDMFYGVSVKYQGAVYGTELDLSGGSPPPVSLTVYEAVDDETSLAVSSASVLMAQVDKASQTLWALEIVRLNNGTDRTYVPGPEPMKLLRFGLPPGAEGLQVDTNLIGAEVLQVDRGFALTASVPPGEHEVMYAYQFPYAGTEAVFSRTLHYGAGSVRVLAPYEVAQVSSQQLEGPETVIVGGRSYQELQGSDMPRGSHISLDLVGLPQPTFRDRLGRRLETVPLEYIAPTGLGLLMVSLVAFAIWRRSTGRRAYGDTMAGMDALGKEQSRLIQKIAQLDESFEEGSLTEGRHQRERAALTARLADLARHRLTRLE